MKIDIWTEGVADQKFLADVLNLWFKTDNHWNETDKGYDCRDALGNIQVKIRIANASNSADAKSTGGKDYFISQKVWQRKTIALFRDNESQDVKNLIVLDADDDFKKRQLEVQETVVGVSFNPQNDLFLWPTHRDNGDLERLLEQIIQPKHKIIFDCWDQYEGCLKRHPNEKYTTPARKTKIYAYLEALLGESNSEKEKIKERKRNYTNPDHWNLDHTKEPLKPLYDFLKKHLMP